MKSDKIKVLPCSRPQSTYRGRVEIGGAYQLVRTPHFVRDGRYSKRGWACIPPPPSPGWASFPSLWNVRQKVAIATLCKTNRERVYDVVLGFGLGVGGGGDKIHDGMGDTHVNYSVTFPSGSFRASTCLSW